MTTWIFEAIRNLLLDGEKSTFSLTLYAEALKEEFADEDFVELGSDNIGYYKQIETSQRFLTGLFKLPLDVSLADVLDEMDKVGTQQKTLPKHFVMSGARGDEYWTSRLKCLQDVRPVLVEHSSTLEACQVELFQDPSGDTSVERGRGSRTIVRCFVR